MLMARNHCRHIPCYLVRALTQLREHHSSLQLATASLRQINDKLLPQKVSILDVFKKRFPKPPASPFREQSEPVGQILPPSNSLAVALSPAPTDKGNNPN